MIARDHRGEVVRGFHASEEADNAEYLEARAVYQGIKLAKEKKRDNVIIETDAVSIVNQICCIDKS